MLARAEASRAEASCILPTPGGAKKRTPLLGDPSRSFPIFSEISKWHFFVHFETEMSWFLSIGGSWGRFAPKPFYKSVKRVFLTRFLRFSLGTFRKISAPSAPYM